LIAPHPQRILIRGVNWLGDAVMTIPALLRLRERFPQATLTLLAPDKLAPLWTPQPWVDQVLPFSRHDGLWQVSRRLRSGHHDLGLALPNSHRTALELWLARIPRRFGLAAPGRTWMFTTAIAPRPGVVRMRKRTPAEARRRFYQPHPSPEPLPPPEAHQLHHYLHLVAALGADPTPISPRLEVAPEEQSRVRSKFGLAPDETWLGLNPGAEYGPAKRWPIERFAAVATQIQASTRCRWILFGGAADVDLACHLESLLTRPRPGTPALPPPVNLAGRTQLGELCAALECCRCLLTNDTGPMHVAAALGVPVIVPFGSTSPELTGPGLPGDPHHRLLRHRVPCAPCFLRACPLALQCLQSISIDEVVHAVRAAAGFTSLRR
jgi:heptosyltransferase II